MNHQEMIDLWCRAYEEHFKSKYVFAGGKDGKAVKTLLGAGIKPTEAIEIARQAWAAPKTRQFWNCDTQSAQLHRFVAAYNAIVAELANTGPKRNYHA